MVLLRRVYRILTQRDDQAMASVLARTRSSVVPWLPVVAITGAYEPGVHP